MAALCVGQVGAALSTLLVARWINTNPVGLELFNAGVPAILSAGIHIRVGTVSPFLAVVAPLPIWMWSDMAWLWGGRRFGTRVVNWALRRADVGRTVAKAESIVSRGGPWVVGVAPWLPVPAVLLYAAAGWTGLTFTRYLTAYLLGTLARTTAVLAVGYLLGSTGERALRAVQQWANLITGIVAVALILALLLLVARRWHRRRRAG